MRTRKVRTVREVETAAFWAALKYGDEESPIECPTCEGSGECEECEGEGTSDCECCNCGHEHDADCDACEGTGECRDCKGSGEFVGAMHPADAWTLRRLNEMRAQMT